MVEGGDAGRRQDDRDMGCALFPNTRSHKSPSDVVDCRTGGKEIFADDDEAFFRQLEKVRSSLALCPATILTSPRHRLVLSLSASSSSMARTTGCCTTLSVATARPSR